MADASPTPWASATSEYPGGGDSTGRVVVCDAEMLATLWDEPAPEHNWATGPAISPDGDRLLSAQTTAALDGGAGSMISSSGNATFTPSRLKTTGMISFDTPAS